VASAATAASSEVRRALAFAGALLALVVEDEGRRVVLPDGRAIDLSRRKNVRLVLCALARARRDAPGVVVSPEALLAAGWAGEKMRADAATKRLHTAIWTLRSVGFEALLVTEGEGYMLDPRVAISP
jgi:DNA-binding SARP family transcriptional activator